MVTGRRRTGFAVASGVVVLVVGVVVLRSRAAQAEVGWFSYGPPPPEVLDGLLAWNLTRAVGAVLVLAGLAVLAHLLGVVAGRRNALLAARLANPALVLAGLLVVGGLVGFVALAAGDRGEATVAISKVIGPIRPLTPWWSVWDQNQTAAALVAATGLVVGAVGTGLRRKNAP